MTSVKNPKKELIAKYIDESLKRVFSDLEDDNIPDEILDLLTVLRAQDEEMQSKE